ncbi:type II toxin-antitoxin system RelE/ParE family toxin [Candidatus Daviesbacteria bacterium]|nr:type II toxin-antitoxin system RelE/ParE family toxin [Candidatus Daviesbacteria bacterium]
MVKVILTRQAEKSLFKLKSSDQKKISKAIAKLIKNPLTGEKLKGEFEGQFKLYAWPYRLIYIFSAKENVVTILEIGHRQGIYK